jgi:hypothetical protein
MPLNVYRNVYESGSIPAGWRPAKDGAIKYPVRDSGVRRYLRTLLSGRWQKVIKIGDTGEIHYFEHESGQVAGVKYFPDQSDR